MSASEKEKAVTFRANSLSPSCWLLKMNGSGTEFADSLPQNTLFSSRWSPRWCLNTQSRKLFFPPVRLPSGLAYCATSANGQAQSHIPSPPHPTISSRFCQALSTDKTPSQAAATEGHTMGRRRSKLCST